MSADYEHLAGKKIDTTQHAGGFRRLLSFLGPAYLVSVGYMDPGNWATDIAAGSRFGYSLVWVLVLSNLMALLLQSLSARLGIVTGMDLAQASRKQYPRLVNYYLYLLAEIAIAACDLAEVLGMAIGLQLLTGIPLIWGVGITVLDSFLLLYLLKFGIRKMEAFIIALMSLIGLSFCVEMFLAQPSISQITSGLVPSLPGKEALYIAIGIIGATVMPHNLYLHSSLVQTRHFSREKSELKKVIRWNVIDSTIALNLAFFVNASILVLSAAAFYSNNLFEVNDIREAHRFLQPLLGSTLAPVLFAVALIAAGQSSTITGTLAGQIVMEGYLNLRIQPWMRRMITRLLAVTPAFFTIYFSGEEKAEDLLILSQVILSMQLGFAIVPLVHFVSNRELMQGLAIKPFTKILSWLVVIIILSLNIKLVIDVFLNWKNDYQPDWLSLVSVVAFLLFSALVLLYIIFRPVFRPHAPSAEIHSKPGEIFPLTQPISFGEICICLDFSGIDTRIISYAISVGGKHAHYHLLHINESAGALVMGGDIMDRETTADEEKLKEYCQQLNTHGYMASHHMGYGNPKKEIPAIVHQLQPHLLIMGAHGHTTFKDIILGTTIDAVRHKVKMPVLVFKE